MKRSYISGKWYLLPLILALAFIGQATYKAIVISGQNTTAEVATYPVIADTEIQTRLKNAGDLIESQKPLTVDEYFATLAELRNLERAAIRNREEGTRYGTNQNDYRSTGTLAYQARMLQNNLANSNVSRMSKLSTEVRESALRRHPLPGDQVRPVGENEFAPIGLAYLLVALFAAPIFFFIRLRREGLMVLPEIAWRLPFWALLWPVGLLKYPVNIDVREQARRFKQWLAAMVSMLLGMSPVAMAHAKSGAGNLGGVEIAQVDQQGRHISTIDPPKPQILPTIVVDGVTVNFSGWAHVQASSEQGPDLTMLKTRLVITDPDSEIQVFSQFDMLRKDQPIDELWVGYGDSNFKVKVGHLFRSSAFSAPAPFLMETITAPRLPVSFFGTGFAIEGSANDNLSFTVDVTGDSRAAPFSGQMFERVDVSGSLKRTHPGGFIRLSAQHVGDLRVIMDGQHQFGPNRVRAAVHYRTGDGRLGGYVFLSRQLNDDFRVFTQLEMENEQLRVLAGLLYSANDNLDFTVEASNDNGWRVRARGRF